MKQWSCAAVFVAAIGIGVPGCFGSNDENEGRICASPVEGGTHCVPSSSGPDAAWNDAKAIGTEPIQMWAVWPDNVELKEVVASPSLVDAWLDDDRTVTDYLRVTQGNAESYHASLAGKLGEDLRRGWRVHNQIISEKAADPEAMVENQLLDKVAQEVNPLKARQPLASVRHLWTLLDREKFATRALGNA